MNIEIHGSRVDDRAARRLRTVRTASMPPMRWFKTAQCGESALAIITTGRRLSALATPRLREPGAFADVRRDRRAKAVLAPRWRSAQITQGVGACVDVA